MWSLVTSGRQSAEIWGGGRSADVSEVLIGDSRLGRLKVLIGFVLHKVHKDMIHGPNVFQTRGKDKKWRNGSFLYTLKKARVILVGQNPVILRYHWHEVTAELSESGSSGSSTFSPEGKYSGISDLSMKLLELRWSQQKKGRYSLIHALILITPDHKNDSFELFQYF